MKPKKIYLRENELEDQFMCERMVSCDASIGSCNVEYTDISQVWHDASEEPTIEQTCILATNEKDIIDVFHLREGRKYNLDGYLVDWSDVVMHFNLTKWSYISDILPK